MSNKILLTGCAQVPLMKYLKALGIFRIVAEQFDENILGAWTSNGFAIESCYSLEELCDFILFRYKPTPILAPWNGGSGFGQKDKNQKEFLALLLLADGTRLDSYKNSIEKARNIVDAESQLTEDDKLRKTRILRKLRASMPDEAVLWMDTAIVVGEEEYYPPILGSGGNDGRFEFTFNFIKRLFSVLPELIRASARSAKNKKKSSEKNILNEIERSKKLLNAALISESNTQLDEGTIGQFYPSDTEVINSWDFILTLEGTLLLSNATVRQLESSSTRSQASFPFTTKSSAVGYGTAVDAEKTRGEMWFPIWNRMASYSEIAHIFREGRVQFSTGKRRVRNSFDFARAVAELGVDRGIDAFQRYCFFERNGKAYFAVPLGMFQVKERPIASLVYEIDRWLESLSRAVSDQNTPPRLLKACRDIEESVFKLCSDGLKESLKETLISLGAAELELSRSTKYRTEKELKPLHKLSQRWHIECRDNTDEYQIAAAVASITGHNDHGIRINLFEQHSINNSLVWDLGSIEENLAAILHRRSVEARMSNLPHPEITGVAYASLSSIAEFLNYKTDDSEIERLILGLSLIDWKKTKHVDYTNSVIPASLPRVFALLKLLFLPDGRLIHNDKEFQIKHEPRIVPLLCSNRIDDAVDIAFQRLTATGLIPVTSNFHYKHHCGHRLAASLLIPLSQTSIQQLAELVLFEIKQN